MSCLYPWLYSGRTPFVVEITSYGNIYDSNDKLWRDNFAFRSLQSKDLKESCVFFSEYTRCRTARIDWFSSFHDRPTERYLPLSIPRAGSLLVSLPRNFLFLLVGWIASVGPAVVFFACLFLEVYAHRKAWENVGCVLVV